MATEKKDQPQTQQKTAQDALLSSAEGLQQPSALPPAPQQSTGPQKVTVQQVVNLELKMQININKEKVGAEEMLSAEYSQINWKGVQDTKEDIRLVIARSCNLQPETLVVRECIPDASGLQYPRLVVSFPRHLTQQEMQLITESVTNYFELIVNPAKVLPTLFEENADEKLKEDIRKVATNFVARRNGRELPCDIIVTGANFSSPIKCKTKVAKPHHKLTPGAEYEMEGKADGFQCSNHKLNFKLKVDAKDKKGLPKIKFKGMKIGYDQSKFEKDVIALPHGSDAIIKVAVQDFTQGKRTWTGLVGIIYTGLKRKN